MNERLKLRGFSLQPAVFCANNLYHMRNTSDSGFSHVAFTHFVPSFFTGIILLYLWNSILNMSIIVELSKGVLSMDDFVVSSCNGVLTACVVVLFHIMRNRSRARKDARSHTPAQTRMLVNAAIVGFAGGALDVLLMLHVLGIMGMTLIVVVILGGHIRVFINKIPRMLTPGNTASWSDVSEMARIYMTMLAGFTLVNATLDGAHMLIGSTPPFGFAVNNSDIFLNSLYFTVVTMTTLGFGDIVPNTWDGKLLLIFQCLVGYVMFALMVGIITRGVIPGKNSKG
ncbi:potassium channel family protein [Pseudodesulfovibrio sediminis]|uniref:Potassium channel domain-containing protein n=1 Tax=Pseudodesulfovibrio sediminis TaxID=2810563 RepID=A0ABM7P4J4_9BACT|nr:potassium channel family protein [Pseudodesulfovibrio sediminis]BCS88542.1 hypothetical protein PSDVSF_17840 [Pseudodesulfovibrio sediminis]